MIPAGVQGTSAVRPAMQAARIHRVKAVHILGRRDRVQQRLRIHLRGQRQLNQDAVDLLTCVELGHQLHHLFSGDGGRRRNKVAENAQVGTALHFAADVDLRGGHVAHQHRRQARLDAARGQRPDLFGHLLLDRRGQRHAIENSRHLALLRFIVSPLASAAEHAALPTLKRRDTPFRPAPCILPLCDFPHIQPCPSFA